MGFLGDFGGKGLRYLVGTPIGMQDVHERTPIPNLVQIRTLGASAQMGEI